MGIKAVTVSCHNFHPFSILFISRFVFGITAVFPLIVSCTSLLIDEKKIQLPPSARQQYALVGAVDEPDAPPPAIVPLGQRLMNQGRGLWSAISRKDILLPTVFVFLWQVGVPFSLSIIFNQKFPLLGLLGYSICGLGHVLFSGEAAAASVLHIIESVPVSHPAQTNQLGFSPEFLGRVSES